MRKIGGITLRSIGDVARHQSIKDNDEPFVAPDDMLRELMADNKAMAAAMRKAHEIADKHEDVATASLLENFIDATERRTWFLFEASREPEPLSSVQSPSVILGIRASARSIVRLRHSPQRLHRGSLALSSCPAHLRRARRPRRPPALGRLRRLPDQRHQPLARILAVARWLRNGWR